MEVTLCFGVNPMLILLFNIKRDKSKVESFPKNPPVLTQSDLHRLFNKAQGSLKRTDGCDGSWFVRFNKAIDLN